MCILVVKETVNDNGTSCKRLPAKFQAYKEQEYFTLQKRIWQPFVPTELKSLDGITMARPAISAKRFSVFCHRVMSQVSMEANGLDKEKWTHAALYTLYFLSFPKWEEHVRGSCSVQWKQTSFGETMQPRHIQSLSIIHRHKELE